MSHSKLLQKHAKQDISDSHDEFYHSSQFARALPSSVQRALFLHNFHRRAVWGKSVYTFQYSPTVLG